jgi:hypothetical protein
LAADLGGMSRFARVLLALAVVFVVTSRTEAAAEHCRKLAEATTAAAAPVPASDAAPCHGAHKAAESAKPTHPQDQPGQERCECMAVLAGYVSAVSAVSSAHIEPYAWARPEAVGFASIEPAPDWRPPRA